MSETLLAKAKKEKTLSRRTSVRSLPKDEVAQLAVAYLKEEISLTHIRDALGFKENDINSAYRIVAIGCREAFGRGILKEGSR